jgi:predicted transposase YbfD/YdcC
VAGKIVTLDAMHCQKTFEAAADAQAQALLKLIERLRHQVARELGRPVVEIEVISCYEAGYDGFWLHHVLEAHGVHNHVLDPASLLVNRRAKSAKTDRIDVERMQRALVPLFLHLRALRP